MDTLLRHGVPRDDNGRATPMVAGSVPTGRPAPVASATARAPAKGWLDGVRTGPVTPARPADVRHPKRLPTHTLPPLLQSSHAGIRVWGLNHKLRACCNSGGGILGSHDECPSLSPTIFGKLSN